MKTVLYAPFYKYLNLLKYINFVKKHTYSGIYAVV